MKTTSLSLLLRILVSCALAFVASTGAAAPYFTVHPATAVVEPGTPIDFAATLHSAPLTGDTLSWYATAGEIEMLSQPETPPLIGTARWVAPTESGVFKVHVRSSHRPLELGEARVIVRGDRRLILESDAWIFLGHPGDDAAIQASLLEVDGSLLPADLTWTSSAPEIVAVSASGHVTAVAGFGSVTLTGSMEGLEPLHVQVSIGSVATGARVLGAGDLLFFHGIQALLDISVLGPVNTGDVLVSGQDFGFIGEVGATSSAGNRASVILSPATPEEAFTKIRFEGQVPVSIPVDALESASLACQSEPAISFEPIFESGSWEPDQDLSLRTSLEVGREGTSFELALVGAADSAASGLLLDLTTAAGGSFLCELGATLASSRLTLGPGLAFDPNITVGLGAAASVGDGGHRVFRAPAMTAVSEAVRYGFSYDSGGYHGLHERAAGPSSASYPPGIVPISVSTATEAAAELYTYLDIGLSPRLALESVGPFDLLRHRPMASAIDLALHDPLSSADFDYQGPFWRLSLGTDASLAPLTSSPDLGDLLTALGLPNELALTESSAESLDFFDRPSISVSADEEGSPVPAHSVVTVTSGPELASERLELVSWRDGETASVASPLAGPFTLDAEGGAVISVPRPAELLHVAARIYDAHYGDAGLPYGGGTAQIGGPSGVTIDVSPHHSFVRADNVITYTATVTGSAVTDVVWTASAGTIDPFGAWTAPADAGTHTITATSVADPSVSATATATVTQSMLVTDWQRLSPWNTIRWLKMEGNTKAVKYYTRPPSWLVTATEHLGYRYETTVTTDIGSNLNYLGLVFGYRPGAVACGPAGATCDLDFLLFDWRGVDRDGAVEGKTLSLIRGHIDPADRATFWLHDESAAPALDVLATQQGPGTGFVGGTEYRLALTYEADRITIDIDGVRIFDVSAEDAFGVGSTETFAPGRFGVYTNELPNAKFFDMEYADLP